MTALLVLGGFAWLLLSLRNTKESLMATQAEHAQALRDLKAQNDRAAAESAAAFKKLEDAIAAAGGTTPEVDAAMAELKASIQRDDDAHPDLPADPPADPPAEPSEPAAMAARGKVGIPPTPPRGTAV